MKLHKLKKRQFLQCGKGIHEVGSVAPVDPTGVQNGIFSPASSSLPCSRTLAKTLILSHKYTSARQSWKFYLLKRT